jgi:Protein of unknown function (DUF4232)
MREHGDVIVGDLPTNDRGGRSPMGGRLRAAAGGLSIAVAAVALSACSSSPSGTRTTTTTRPHTTTTTSSATTSTTTTSPVVATCQVSDLRIATTGQGGAAGTQEVTFSLTNTSTTSCPTYGYPGMLLVRTTGAALPTTVIRGGSLTFEDIAPTHVTLGPGLTAYFNLGFTDVQTATTTCSSTHTVEVTPPTNTTHATVNVGLGIDACDNGTLHVSAVFSSTDSSATQTTAPG